MAEHAAALAGEILGAERGDRAGPHVGDRAGIEQRSRHAGAGIEEVEQRHLRRQAALVVVDIVADDLDARHIDRREIAAQEPVWIRGATRTLTAMAAGEYSLFLGPNFNTVMRAIKKDVTGTLDLKLLEPVPVRLTEALAVLASSERPYTALLWIEFQASPKGQKIVDDLHPYGASAFIPGSAQEKLVRGKRTSIVQWDHFSQLGDYQAKVVGAYGFPKEQKKQ